MAYRVDISVLAAADIDETLAWLHRRSDRSAGKWYAALQVALGSLRSMPNRCPIATKTHSFLIEIRYLLFGEGSLQYRIIFGVSVDERSGEDVVTIYRVRGSKRRSLSGFEIFGEKDNE